MKEAVEALRGARHATRPSSSFFAVTPAALLPPLPRPARAGRAARVVGSGSLAAATGASASSSSLMAAAAAATLRSKKARTSSATAALTTSSRPAPAAPAKRGELSSAARLACSRTLVSLRRYFRVCVCVQCNAEQERQREEGAGKNVSAGGKKEVRMEFEAKPKRLTSSPCSPRRSARRGTRGLRGPRRRPPTRSWPARGRT